MLKIILIFLFVIWSQSLVHAQNAVNSKEGKNSYETKSIANDKNTSQQLQRHNYLQSLPDSQKISATHRIGMIDTTLTTSPHFLGWDTIITPTMRYYPPPKPKQK